MRTVLLSFIVSSAVIRSHGLQVVNEAFRETDGTQSSIAVTPTGLLVTLLDLCNVRANVTQEQGDQSYELFQAINATNIDLVMDSIANLTGESFPHFQFCYSTTVMSHFERCGDKIKITDSQLELMKEKFPQNFPAMVRDVGKFMQDMKEVFGDDKGEDFVDCSIDPFLKRDNS